MSIRQPISVDRGEFCDGKKISSATRTPTLRTHLEFSALVGDVIAGSGRSVERAAMFRATPVCVSQLLTVVRQGEGGGFASRDRRLRSARNVDGPGLVEDDVAARVVVGERIL